MRGITQSRTWSRNRIPSRKVMPRHQVERDRSLNADVVDFLSELARYLLAVGITSTRFAGMARLAFFQAASRRAKFSNDKLNQSAVAAMTGLTRRQVRQFAKQAVPPTRRDRIDALLEGWSTDATFTTTGHAPKRLRRSGRGYTFSALVRKYGGDIPAKSFLRELERYGYVSVRDGFVYLRPGARRTREEMLLRRITQAMANFLREPAVSTSLGTARTLAAEISFPATSDKGRTLLNKRLGASLRAFLDGAQAAGVAASIDSPPGRKQRDRITRMKVLIKTEDFADQNLPQLVQKTRVC